MPNADAAEAARKPLPTMSRSAGGFWAARAETYSKSTARATVQAAPALLAAVRVRPFTRLLDIACGPGYLAGAAAALGCRALGVDISGEMVAVARARQPFADFEIGDAEALREPDGLYDLAVCNFGVFHFSQPERAFAEARRVLAPGGAYAFSQWLAPERSTFFAEVAAAAVEAGLAVAARPQAFRLSDPTAAAAALTAAGFEAVAVRDEPIVYHAPTGDFLAVLRELALPLELPITADPALAERLRAALDRRLERYRVGAEYRVPMPALVASGRKPE